MTSAFLSRSLVAASLLALAAIITALPQRVSAEDPSLAIDVGTEGNGPTSVGEIHDCISVGAGDRFDVDVLIQDVTDLLAWEVHPGLRSRRAHSG